MEGRKVMCGACGTMNWTDFEFCRNCNQKIDLKDEKKEEDETRERRETSLSHRLHRGLKKLHRAS